MTKWDKLVNSIKVEFPEVKNFDSVFKVFNITDKQIYFKLNNVKYIADLKNDESIKRNSVGFFE